MATRVAGSLCLATGLGDEMIVNRWLFLVLACLFLKITIDYNIIIWFFFFLLAWKNMKKGP